MRIIAGRFRSRRLVAPAGRQVRPTSDRLRETLFNVLQPHIGGAEFADLYAGSGAVGFEALSRGARHVLFAENHKDSLLTLRENACALSLKEGPLNRASRHEDSDFRIAMAGTELALRSIAFSDAKLDIAFLDPPYDASREYAATLTLLATLPVLAPCGVVIAEHARKHPPPDRAEGLVRYRLLEQGDSALSFYSLFAN